MSDQPDPHRRFFFRDAAARAIGPIADLLAAKFPTTLPREVILRPPGSIHEDLFNDICKQCGECVRVCPAHAIFPLGESYGTAAGTPAITPSSAACVVCDGLQCTHVCPSGALLPVLDATLIRMGTAEVYAGLCRRSQGEPCTECVDRCPIGTTAIQFPGQGPPQVLAEGCVGCGVCEQYCPTAPKAIVVRPIESG